MLLLLNLERGLLFRVVDAICQRESSNGTNGPMVVCVWAGSG